MSRAMFVTGFVEAIPEDPVAAGEVGIDMTYPPGSGVSEVDEPDVCATVVIEVAKLDPKIKFLRVQYY